MGYYVIDLSVMSIYYNIVYASIYLFMIAGLALTLLQYMQRMYIFIQTPFFLIYLYITPCFNILHGHTSYFQFSFFKCITFFLPKLVFSYHPALF